MTPILYNCFSPHGSFIDRPKCKRWATDPVFDKCVCAVKPRWVDGAVEIGLDIAMITDAEEQRDPFNCRVKLSAKLRQALSLHSVRSVLWGEGA